MTRLLVLGWHNISPSWCFAFRPGSGCAGIERQLRFLAATCNVMPLAESLDTIFGGGELPPRAVAITFDDGYRDNLVLGAPLLHRLGLPATFFLVPELLDGAAIPWWEVAGWAFAETSATSLDWEGVGYDLSSSIARRRSYSSVAECLKRRNNAKRRAAVDELVDRLQPRGAWQERARFMDWEDARELAGRGFAIGSHSSRHSILSEETAEEQHEDIALSLRRLEVLGVPVDVLAYPNGTRRDFGPATCGAAVSAGFRFALTTVDGFNSPETPPYELRRFVMYPERGLSDFSGTVRSGVDRRWLTARR